MGLFCFLILKGDTNEHEQSNLIQFCQRRAYIVV